MLLIIKKILNMIAANCGQKFDIKQISFTLEFDIKQNQMSYPNLYFSNPASCFVQMYAQLLLRLFVCTVL